MSASIYYQPMKGIHLPMGGPSSFLEALRELFGDRSSFELTEGAYFTLQGLKAGLTSTDQKEAVEALLDAISVYGTVRVWAEY